MIVWSTLGIVLRDLFPSQFIENMPAEAGAVWEEDRNLNKCSRIPTRTNNIKFLACEQNLCLLLSCPGFLKCPPGLTMRKQPSPPAPGSPWAGLCLCWSRMEKGRWWQLCSWHWQEADIDVDLLVQTKTLGRSHTQNGTHWTGEATWRAGKHRLIIYNVAALKPQCTQQVIRQIGPWSLLGLWGFADLTEGEKEEIECIRKDIGLSSSQEEADFYSSPLTSKLLISSWNSDSLSLFFI